MKSFLFIAWATASMASPCPFGQMAERGELSPEDAGRFYAARSDGEAYVKRDIEAHLEAAKRDEYVAQEQFYKRQLGIGDLPFGMLQSAIVLHLLTKQRWWSSWRCFATLYWSIDRSRCTCSTT